MSGAWRMYIWVSPVSAKARKPEKLQIVPSPLGWGVRSEEVSVGRACAGPRAGPQ